MFGQIKTIFSIIMALLILCIVALSQTTEKKPERNFKVEGEVYAVTQQWADAMGKADDEALSQVLSDDLIVTFSSGKSRGKKDQLEAAKRIIFFTLNDLRLSVNSNTALVTCYANIRYTANDKEVEEERQYTSTLLNQQGKWRIVAQQINLTSQAPSQLDTKSLSENSTVERATSSVQIEPKVASFENGYKIGQRIPAGEFALTVLGIETSRSSYTDTYAVKAGNVMLAVQVKLETNQWNPFHTIAQQKVLLIGRNGSYQLSATGGNTKF